MQAFYMSVKQFFFEKVYALYFNTSKNNLLAIYLIIIWFQPRQS